MAGGTILISLHVFRSKLVESRSQIVVQSDSLAAVSVCMKLSWPNVCIAQDGAVLYLLEKRKFY